MVKGFGGFITPAIIGLFGYMLLIGAITWNQQTLILLVIVVIILGLLRRK